MKLYPYLIIAGVSIFSACQSKETKIADNNLASTTKQSCYTYTKNKDTVSLTTMASGHIITGELNYQLFEKDSNHGTIKGEMRGDTLVADYTYNSEGKQSIRQVAFLKKDGKLLEGYGEIMDQQGKMTFKAISTLKFGNAIEFTEVNCN